MITALANEQNIQETAPVIRFVVYGNPKHQKRHRTFRVGKTKQVDVNWDPSDTDKADFLSLAHQYRPEKPINGPVSLKVVCYFSRPKSHYRTGRHTGELRPDAPIWCATKPDGDNLLKFVLDALNGVYWTDDSRVVKACVAKLYDERPRTEIEVSEIVDDRAESVERQAGSTEQLPGLFKEHSHE
jgi:Holliday junction resolvase RusA-like endonuclease